MFSTCLFCHGPLGTNESVEGFPVGRRLAFDAARGRLWVVCRRCERWNLSPLEERWEAIESAERLFRGTRLRVSTGEIGLARVAEGLELVRVGQPMRPEFAAWRYGDQFGRRRRRQILITAAAVAVGGAVVVAGPMAAVVGGGGLPLMNLAIQGWHQYWRRRVTVRIPRDDAPPIEITGAQLSRAKLVPGSGPEGWALAVAHRGALERVPGSLLSKRFTTKATELTGATAIRAAGLILPKLNAYGGSRARVQSAVQQLESAGGPEAFFGAAVRMKRQRSYASAPYRALANLPAEVRLALEMAAHEDTERRALEGELAELEQAWRDAEEIAQIADNLLVPDDVDAQLERMHADSRSAGAGSEGEQR